MQQVKWYDVEEVADVARGQKFPYDYVRKLLRCWALEDIENIKWNGCVPVKSFGPFQKLAPAPEAH
jgi:hypothetical protein